MCSGPRAGESEEPGAAASDELGGFSGGEDDMSAGAKES
jgi:hypothetical protein